MLAVLIVEFACFVRSNGLCSVSKHGNVMRPSTSAASFQGRREMFGFHFPRV